jgi:hypothetical protein
VDTIIGIDPGNRGGVVVLRNQDTSEQVGIEKPEGWHIERVFRLERGEIAISEFFGEYRDFEAGTVAYLENVHGWGEGRSFAFGRYYGFVRGCLYCCGMRSERGSLIDVTPQTWMKEMGVPKQKEIGKAKHRQAMRELAASMQDEVETTNWNSAAILIALYGLRRETGRGLLGEPVRA